MPKRTSKRRWLARWRIGKPIPDTALCEWPDLVKRLRPSRRSHYSCFIIRDDQ